MSNSYDEIKKLLKASNNMLKKNVVEEQKGIKNLHGLLVEQDDVIDRINPMKDTAEKIKSEEETASDKKQSFRISGGVLTLHGKDKKDLELTTDEKISFQETMDEFINEVSDLVDFEPLNVYKNDVEWGGKIIDFDMEFYFAIGESNGIYINGTMMKIDENFTDILNKLQTYYEKFKSKWAKVLASRKKTESKPQNNE